MEFAIVFLLFVLIYIYLNKKELEETNYSMYKDLDVFMKILETCIREKGFSEENMRKLPFRFRNMNFFMEINKLYLENKNATNMYVQYLKLNQAFLKCKQENTDKQKKIVELEEFLHEKENFYEEFKTDLSCGFDNLSEFIADFTLQEYSITEKYLDSKKHPAHKRAREVAELREKTKEYLLEYKLMKYQYEYLFKIFPELEVYIEDFSVLNREKDKIISKNKNVVDEVEGYLTKEEYANLSERKRNQLALDRYISSHNKSKWDIGRDYEMYTAYCYQMDGWKVVNVGIEKKLEDMGRDLVCVRGDETLIIQCKYWSKEKIIREKHIAQLYGTTVQYIIENNVSNVVPVFVTNISLSSTARKFAKYLNVKIIENRELEEFPRIKCNINRTESGDISKIYHLPIDQQYDSTKIEKSKGEFFAWTVDEAEENGFRRARKHYVF